jgi:cytochrome c6
MKTLLRSIILLPITVSLLTPSLWSADAAPDGSKTYAAKCAACHAKDGTGNPNMAKIFKVDPAALDMTKKATMDKTDADLAKAIKEGVNKMPPYKDKLSDADIAAVVTYLRSLAKK